MKKHYKCTGNPPPVWMPAPPVSSIRSIKALQSSSLLWDPMANTSVALEPPSREKDHLSCRCAILPGRHLHLEIENTLTTMMNRTPHILYICCKKQCANKHICETHLFAFRSHFAIRRGFSLFTGLGDHKCRSLSYWYSSLRLLYYITQKYVNVRRNPIPITKAPCSPAQTPRWRLPTSTRYVGT